MVPSGSALTFDVQGATGGLIPVDDTELRSGVIGALTPFFGVSNVSITKGSLFGNLIGGQWLHWSYSAAVTVRTKIDYGQLADVASVVAHAFYQAGGALPTVTSREAGEHQDAGIVETGIDFGAAIDDVIERTSAAAAGAGQGIGDALGNALKPFTDLLQGAGLLIVGGIIIVVAVIVFSPAGREAGKSVGKIRAI